MTSKTHDGGVHLVAEVGERLVHVDAQGLGEVLAVVVLAVAEQDLSKRGKGIRREFNLGRSRLT